FCVAVLPGDRHVEHPARAARSVRGGNRKLLDPFRAHGSRVFWLCSFNDKCLARSSVAAIHHQLEYFWLLLGCISLKLSCGELAKSRRRTGEIDGTCCIPAGIQ